MQDRDFRFYGRIKSRRLSSYKKDCMQSILDKFGINSLSDCDDIQQYDKICFEIGFGYGD